VSPRRLSLLIAGALLSAAASEAAPPVCNSPARLMQFPSAANPVWEFCFLTPINSTSSDGSGIDIYDVRYNGHQVFKRANIPVLNVKYAPGGCGCFRDWLFDEIKFEAKDANGQIITGPQGSYTDAASVRTVCESGGSGGDIPPGVGFQGVAGEKLPDRLILTSQSPAGWYRYVVRWTFYLDGRIHPEMGYAATASGCISSSHHHNSYWRLDFDIDNATNMVGEPGGMTQNNESGTRRPAEPFGLPPLKVYNPTSGRGYHVEAQGHIGDTYDPYGPFSIGDAWILKFNASQTGDPSPSCAIGSTFLGYSNNEPINPADVVVWYHEGKLHKAGQLDACGLVGPMLEPFGDWSLGAP
jgi:hypothetical protein